MTYPAVRHQGEPRTGGHFRSATQPPDLSLGGQVAHYLATGTDTSGDFALIRYEMPDGSGPSAHFHRTFSESFYVLSGQVRLYDGVRWVDGGAGDFLHVPPGGVHAFRNESGAPASILLLFAPGAPRETYFEELRDVVASGRTLSQREWTELYARHDQYMV